MCNISWVSKIFPLFMGLGVGLDIRYLTPLEMISMLFIVMIVVP